MHGGKAWTWRELEFLRDHPDWTSPELAEELEAMGFPRRTASAVMHARQRYGRYCRDRSPMCARCMQRRVLADDPKARRMGLCAECYADELRLRERDKKRNDALRQMRMRDIRHGGIG